MNTFKAWILSFRKNNCYTNCGIDIINSSLFQIKYKVLYTCPITQMVVASVLLIALQAFWFKDEGITFKTALWAGSPDSWTKYIVCLCCFWARILLILWNPSLSDEREECTSGHPLTWLVTGQEGVPYGAIESYPQRRVLHTDNSASVQYRLEVCVEKHSHVLRAPMTWF